MENRAGLLSDFTKADPGFVAAIFAIQAATASLRGKRRRQALQDIKDRGDTLVRLSAVASIQSARKSGVDAIKQDQENMRRAGQYLLCALAMQPEARQ
jgi:hypothetical protein